MTTNVEHIEEQSVLGQKYAYATAALIAGITCYVNLVGMEKAIMAILFAWLALRSDPAPLLTTHRNWAKVGAGLGIVLIILVPTLLLLNLDRIVEVIDTLSKLK